MKRALLLIAGSLSVALGVAGIFLPILPTTPFLLLAAACYLRSSKRLHDKLLGHPILGAYIRNYRYYRALPRKTKLGALAMLWASISVSIWVVPLLPVRLGLLGIAVAVSAHILSLRTLTPELRRELEAKSREDCCA